MESANHERDRAVRRVLVVEGLVNLSLVVAKSVVAVSTGSLALAGDALHTLTDAGNNVLAWFTLRIAQAPPDEDHPYGHRKFETLAVFVLATLMAVLAVELALAAVRRDVTVEVADSFAGLVVIGIAAAAGFAVAIWEGRAARRLNSALLEADAHHSFADALGSLALIGGWQLAVHVHPVLDRVVAFLAAVGILVLAFGLFRRVLPILVDGSALDADELASALREVDGVRGVGQVRSRATGASHAADVVIRVDGQLETHAAHDVADEVETLLRERYGIADVVVHIEPASPR